MRPSFLAAGVLLGCTAGPAPVGDTDAGGQGDTDVGSDTDVSIHPGPDTTVVALRGTLVYFTGDDNQRQVDVPVSLPPADQTFAGIELRVKVRCPTGGRCDPWDRLGYLGVLVDGGTDAAPRLVELTRFVTPYGVGDRWKLDVTDLRPILTGDVTLRVFIDTWVGPGSTYGDGWAVDATLDFTGGVPPRDVLAVLPLVEPTYVPYGDPLRPPATTLPTQPAPLPDGATSVAVRTFVTGHGQGNADNCAEFCARDHTLVVGDAVDTRSLWRADCATTGAPNQQGSWRYSRAGWCPGAEVLPWTLAADTTDTTVEVGWSVEDDVNTCRPDAPTCTGCTLGTGCAYDGGAHTEPYYEVSQALIVYGG